MEEGSGATGGEEIALEVPADGKPDRADKVLTGLLPEYSRARLQKLFAAGHVWRESDALGKSDRLHPGDALTVTIPPARSLNLRPVNIPLDIIYEDEHLLAVNKPVGMVVHPGSNTGEDTLVHALLFHCRGQLGTINGVERPGIVHRLDKETSGVIVAARSDAAMQGLTRMFAERRLQKTYRAIVLGKATNGQSHQPIGRHPTHRTRMAVRPDGRAAHSEWIVEAALPHVTLLRVRIHTGRTHQIRVHLTDAGYPILGDTTYGYRSNRLPLEVPRVMLHAACLNLTHPVTGESMTLEAPLPEDFSTLLRQLRE